MGKKKVLGKAPTDDTCDVVLRQAGVEGLELETAPSPHATGYANVYYSATRIRPYSAMIQVNGKTARVGIITRQPRRLR